MNFTRLHASNSVRNLRDFGGWPIKAGRQVRVGKLFRSGHWAEAEPSDFDLLDQLSPHFFVDLRRPAEREQQPNLLPKNSTIKTLQSDGGDMREPPHMRFLRAGNLTRQSVHDYMQSAYERIPKELHHQELFRQTLFQLAEGKSVLVHCAAGKDRTGILAGLILSLLGVADEHVFEDYLLTNQAVDIEGILPQIAKRMSEQLEQIVEPEVIFPMLGVEREFLETAKQVIGDPNQYACDVLQVPERVIVQLRERLVHTGLGDH